MEERIPLLRGKVGSEAKGMEKRLNVLSQEWEAGRPLSKDHTPSEVRMTIAMAGNGDMYRCSESFGSYILFRFAETRTRCRPSISIPLYSAKARDCCCPTVSIPFGFESSADALGTRYCWGPVGASIN